MMANVFYCNGQIYSFAPGQPGLGAPGVMQPVQPLSMPSNGANNGGQSHFGMTPSAAAAAVAQPQNKGLVADLCKIIERQSQEIASLVQTRADKEQPNTTAVAAAAASAYSNARRRRRGRGKSCTRNIWRPRASLARTTAIIKATKPKKTERSDRL